MVSGAKINALSGDVDTVATVDTGETAANAANADTVDTADTADTADTGNVVTSRKIKGLKNAIKRTKAYAKFTGKNAQETIVWNAGKTLVARTRGTLVGVVAHVADDKSLKEEAKDYLKKNCR